MSTKHRRQLLPAKQFVVVLFFTVTLLLPGTLDGQTVKIWANGPATPAVTSSVPTLRSTFNDVRCKGACWQGIQIDVTTVKELREYWAINKYMPNISSVAPVPGPDNAVISWLADNYPFAPSNPAARIISVTTWKGTVIQMIVPIEICPAQIVDEFGRPSQIGRDSGNIYYLSYFDENLVFTSNFSNPSHQVVLVFLLSEENKKSFSNSSDYPNANWEELAASFTDGCTSGETF